MGMAAPHMHVTLSRVRLVNLHLTAVHTRGPGKLSEGQQAREVRTHPK
jgi:hypothetical protein